MYEPTKILEGLFEAFDALLVSARPYDVHAMNEGHLWLRLAHRYSAYNILSILHGIVVPRMDGR